MNKSTKRYKMKKIKIPNKKDYIESNILYKVLIISFFLLAIPVAVSAQSKETGLLLNKYNIKQIIGAMTLEEKASWGLHSRSSRIYGFYTQTGDS